MPNTTTGHSYGGAESWNVRDRHMVDTLERVMAHRGPAAKAVVWGHNTHLGVASATDMADAGMVNVGQLVRERHAEDGVMVLGFGSYQGTVLAANAWGSPGQVMTMPLARAGSVEDHLNDAVDEPSLFVFPDATTAHPDWLRDELGHRAVGVVYHPGREQWGNYVPSMLGQRYDAFCYLPRTRALQPIHASPTSIEPETLLTGL